VTVERAKQVAGHVFISYVREDSRPVDRLQQALEAAGIPVWRDTSDLWPGEDWRLNIRRAITENALVFIACFSRLSLARKKTFQNEELTLAIEQMRLRPPDNPWLIPVRFDDCEIPDWDIGGGRTLRSIQRADFFGSYGPERIVAAVLRILGAHSDTEVPEASVITAASTLTEQSACTGQRVDSTIQFTITEPPLVVNGTAHYEDLQQWLSCPVTPASRRRAPAFPVRGRVAPPQNGGQIRIRIHTDQWHDQGEYLIDENGEFIGRIYLNKERAQARLEFTVVDVNGAELLQCHANLT
jgi:hypothetical protein